VHRIGEFAGALNLLVQRGADRVVGVDRLPYALGYPARRAAWIISVTDCWM
jgi:hypothetical protein